MTKKPAQTVWGDAIFRYRKLNNDMSRAALSAKIREAGETEVSEPSIEGYEMKGQHPSKRACIAMDKALGSGRAIQVAAGWFNTIDLDEELARQRDQIAELAREVARIQTQLASLLRGERPPDDPEPHR